MSKYGGWTRNQVEALINMLGEANALALLAGDLTVSFQEAVKTFFDKNGRRIPRNLDGHVCDPSSLSCFLQPDLSTLDCFEERLDRLHACTGVDTGITAQLFLSKTERLLAMIRANKLIAKLSNGVWLPVILPQFSAEGIGGEIKLYLAAVAKSYAKASGGQKFNSHPELNLQKRLWIANASRHQKLVSMLVEGPVIGICFPAALQGFSVEASREQMLDLPENLILSGFDLAAAMVMYPDVLVLGSKAMHSLMSAFYLDNVQSFAGFHVNHDSLGLMHGESFYKHGHSAYSSGLLFVG